LNDEQTPPNSEAPPKPDCEKWAAEIREQYGYAKRQLEMAVEEKWEEAINSAKRTMVLLEHRWRVLKKKCPNIGELEPGVGGGGPPDWNEKQNYRDQALEYRHASRRAERRVNEPPPGGSGGGPAHEFLENTTWAARADYLATVADLYEQMANDPPSRDFHNVLIPAAGTSAVPEKASDLMKLSWAARQAQQEHIAYLRVHLATFERFQGAQAAGDSAAMARQSKAMAHFANAALEKSRAAEQSWQTFLIAAVAAREKAMEEAKKDPKWAEKFAAWQQDVQKNGLGNDLQKKLSDLGMSEQRSKAFEKAIADATPKRLEESLAEAKSQVKLLEAEREARKKAASKSAWPEAADATSILVMIESSYQLYDQTQATGVELEITPAKGEVEGWWILPVGEPVVLRPDSAIKGNKSGPIVPGKYDVWAAATREAMGKVFPYARRVARNVVVEQGKIAKVAVDLEKLKADGAAKIADAKAELTLKLPEGVEQPVEWLVVESGGDSMTPVARKKLADAKSLKVPPGRYDVYLMYSERAVRVAVPEAFGVEAVEGKPAEVNLNGGISVETGAGMEKRDKTGWWAVSHAGRGIDRRLRTIDIDKATLPPGKYDLFWLQSTSHKPVRALTDVEVKAGQWTTAKVESAVAVKWTEKPPAIEKTGGLIASPSGTAVSNRVGMLRGRADGTLVLPPGKYDIYWRPDDKKEATLIKADVELKAGVSTLTAGPK
jgi:hypothetical protein